LKQEICGKTVDFSGRASNYRCKNAIGYQFVVFDGVILASVGELASKRATGTKEVPKAGESAAFSVKKAVLVPLRFLPSVRIQKH
jgi:hypothetical protein